MRTADAVVAHAIRWCTLLAVASGGLACGPAALGAQAAPSAHTAGLTRTQLLITNSAIGAVSAGWRARRAGRAVGPALWRGAVGGTIMAGGFAIGGLPFGAARVLSVQTVAVGASLSRNAGSGVPLMSHLTLPFTPFLVEVTPRRVRLRLSTGGVAALASHLSSGRGMHIDWRSSRDAGGAVLRTASPAFDHGVDCPAGFACARAGSHRQGVVSYREHDAPLRVAATLAHESMHVAQRTRDLVLFGKPLSDATLVKSGRIGRAIGRVLVLDGLMPLQLVNGLSARFVGSSYRSWYEREARTFAPGSAASFAFGAARPLR